jgi:AcrR family transcriptional regulator
MPTMMTSSSSDDRFRPAAPGEAATPAPETAVSTHAAPAAPSTTEAGPPPRPTDEGAAAGGGAGSGGFALPFGIGRAEGQPIPGEATRMSLLGAGLDLFGRKGFDATSTRDIARAAGVNIAGIAYHFGGKVGLHRACAELIGRTIAALFPAAEATDARRDDDLSPDEALERFLEVGSGFARFLLARPEAEAIARFMVREQMDPTATFSIVFEGLIRPRHARMCRLWGRAVGEDPKSEDVIIAVSTVIGQIVFFRVGRATALRVLGWETIDGERVERILAVVRETIRAMAATRRARRTSP